MAEGEGLDELRLDGELNEGHLLALILEVKGITEDEAAFKLQLPKATIHEWRASLESQGLVATPDDEGGQGVMVLTREGERKLKKLGRELEAQEAEEAAPKAKADPKALFRRMSSKAVLKIRDLWLDIVVLCMVVISLKLLKNFADAPDVQALSFFFASLMLSLVLILYQQYKRSMKAAQFVSFFQWAVEATVGQRKIIALAIVVALIMYSVGMSLLHPGKAGLYIIVAVVVAATGHLIYSPKRSPAKIIKFYAGVVLISTGLVLVVGLISLTETLFGNEVRVLDFFFGFSFLFIAYFNQRDFGLGSGPRLG